ncbi:hypothetical protein GCM10010145_68490 [Streptomyces ruber]|uniref:Uncharacterized protein n=2 Tax=Streptomyces TaxID=1883 RepID=A0A918BSB2_9ACTN|nr:hypothetical protein GCM10010145_68490 [Streptomyces ruber]
MVSGEESSGCWGAVLPRGAGRGAAVARLLALDEQGELSTAHVRLMASALDVSERTVWNWLSVARREGRTGPRPRPRFRVTREIRDLLVMWGGNVSAVHRELAARAAEDPSSGPVPSLSVLHRAVVRDLSVGERAGLRTGEAGRRRHDVFGKRPPTYRNACWEGDHKRIPVRVEVEGRAVCPWVTWFIDVASKVIVGVAVTGHEPGRDAVLAALRTPDQPCQALRAVRWSAWAGAGGPWQGTSCPRLCRGLWAVSLSR